MDAIVSLLTRLVAVRTDEVEGDELQLALLLKAELARHAPDAIELARVPRPDREGEQGAYVFARFGTPRLLVNVHLDTVPPNSGWSGDPFVARVESGRLYGLGAADTKGAIAAVLCALTDERPRDVAVLFSGDEERSGGCMRAFLSSDLAQGISQALVCEPTGLQAGTRHRGFVALSARCRGRGGHSSFADSLPSPVGELARLGTAWDDWGRARRAEGPPQFLGMCMNLARLDGGVAVNVVPEEATLLASVRPPPGVDPAEVVEQLATIQRAVAPTAELQTPTVNRPFATRALAGFRRWIGDRVDRPLDLSFWTEAALLSEAGIDAVVIGPGDIACAHAPDEWVSIDELTGACDFFRSVFVESRTR